MFGSPHAHPDRPQRQALTITGRYPRLRPTLGFFVAVILVGACSPIAPSPAVAIEAIETGIPSAAAIITPNPTPFATLTPTCGPAPIFKGYYLIQLNCPGAIAAALGALPPGHPVVSSRTFAWGVYCPPGTPCPTSDGVLLETGYVVVTFIDGTRALVTVHGEPNRKVVATGVEPLPSVGPTS
jgi:hypothetical protein